MTWGQKPCFKVIEGKLRKKSCAHSIAPGIPMSLAKRKSCSARASTIFESHFHGVKVVCPISFCAIYRSTFFCKAFAPNIISIPVSSFYLGKISADILRVQRAAFDPRCFGCLQKIALDLLCMLYMDQF